jgi:hypothetical protein
MALVSILLDIAIAGLLAATIFYAVVLNRKLTELRNNKAEMEATVNRLVQTTEQAEHSLAELKAAAGQTGEQLSRRVTEGRGLADDLGFLVDKASGLADRLERQIGQARSTAGSAASPAAAPQGRTGGAEPRGLSADATAPANAAGPTQSARSWPKTGGAARTAAAAETEPSETAADAGGEAAPRRAAGQGPQNAKLLKALRGVR